MRNKSKTFLSINFGCRVNSAEINQLSQSYLDQGYIPDNHNPNLIIINTCAVTKKGEYESISKIKDLVNKYPHSQIVATGCANLTKLPLLKNLTIINKNNLSSFYTHQIKDKFSHTNRYLLKIQSGCTQFCSYCIVPYCRPTLWSLPIDQAIATVIAAIKDGYQEIIITGVNIDQYQYNLSNLLKELLTKTSTPLISFGSVPINSIDKNFLNLFKKYPNRLSHFLHIPIQSGSDKILKLMNRPYNVKKILKIFNSLKNLSPLPNKEGDGGRLSFGTDIIVGFPGETDKDFQETLKLCQKIGFTKIHTFRFSPRPKTLARNFFLKLPKIPKKIIYQRSSKIRSLMII